MGYVGQARGTSKGDAPIPNVVGRSVFIVLSWPIYEVSVILPEATWLQLGEAVFSPMDGATLSSTR